MGKIYIHVHNVCMCVDYCTLESGAGLSVEERVGSSGWCVW